MRRRTGRETEGDGVAVGTHDDDGHTTFGEGGEGGEGEGGGGFDDDLLDVMERNPAVEWAGEIGFAVACAGAIRGQFDVEMLAGEVGAGARGGEVEGGHGGEGRAPTLVEGLVEAEPTDLGGAPELGVARAGAGDAAYPLSHHARRRRPTRLNPMGARRGSSLSIRSGGAPAVAKFSRRTLRALERSSSVKTEVVPSDRR